MSNDRESMSTSGRSGEHIGLDLRSVLAGQRRLHCVKGTQGQCTSCRSSVNRCFISALCPAHSGRSATLFNSNGLLGQTTEGQQLTETAHGHAFAFGQRPDQTRTHSCVKFNISSAPCFHQSMCFHNRERVCQCKCSAKSTKAKTKQAPTHQIFSDNSHGQNANSFEQNDAVCAAVAPALVVAAKTSFIPSGIISDICCCCSCTEAVSFALQTHKCCIFISLTCSCGPKFSGCKQCFLFVPANLSCFFHFQNDDVL